MFEGLPEHCGTLEECRRLATEIKAAEAAQEDTLHIAELKGKRAGLQRAKIADAKGASLSVLTAPGAQVQTTKMTFLALTQAEHSLCTVSLPYVGCITTG